MDSVNTVGYSSATPNNLLIDSGALYKNYGLENEALIGATSGGNEFTVNVKTRDVKVDGVKGLQKGLRFITDVEINLKTNMLEVTTDILKMALLGTVDGTGVDYDVITGKTSIESTDYLTNVALVGRISGSLLPVIVILKNVLNTDGLKFKTEDDKDNVLPITFTAFSDPTTPTVLPYEIRYPKAGSLAALFLENTPMMNGGKIQLDFNASTTSVVPFTGFAVKVGGVTNVVTAATRNVNNLSIVDLTLTTPLVSGSVVTLAYTKSVTVGEQVTALSGGTLATFTARTVTNN